MSEVHQIYAFMAQTGTPLPLTFTEVIVLGAFQKNNL